jgi:hypothetical protein
MMAVAVALSGADTARAQRADGPVAPGAPEQRDLRQQAAGASAPVPPQRQGGAAQFVAGQASGQTRFREIRRAVVVGRRGEEVGRVEGVILDGSGRSSPSAASSASPRRRSPWRGASCARHAACARPSR